MKIFMMMQIFIKQNNYLKDLLKDFMTENPFIDDEDDQELN